MKFISAIFAVIFSTTFAFAQTSCSFGYPSENISTMVYLEETDEAYAKIIIENKEAIRDNRIEFCTLNFENDPVIFRVYYDPFQGSIPDDFKIEVPIGFVAEHDYLRSVPDNTSVEVLIYQIGLS
jgi:hypothetical protein